MMAFLILFILLLAGCAYRYPVVGAFDNYNEVFRGTVHHNAWNGTAYIEVKAENSDVMGRGNSRVTYIPPLFSWGDKQRGEADLEFDDGRSVKAYWTAESLTTGFGSGHDQFGNTFKFAFGMSDQEADKYISKKSEEVARKPELPPYRPKEVRQSQGFSTGTGFFVSDSGHILTNYHVVEDATTITVKDISGTLHQAKYLRGDSANDVALLKIDSSTKPLNILSYADVEKGSEVFTLGFPLVQIQGQEQKATFGRVNALSGAEDDVRFLQIDVPLQPGNSGGALFDHTGSVVGVTTATLNQVNTLKQSGMLPQNVNYAVKIDYIIPLLRGIVTIQNHETMNKPLLDLIKTLEGSVVMIITK